MRTILAAAAAVAAIGTASAAPTIIFESADGSGLNPRFGLSASTADGVTTLSGDPVVGFADYYSGNALSLSDFNVAPGDFILGSTAVQFNPGNVNGASDARIIFRFYADVDNDGNLFGDDGDFANRVEILGDFIDFDQNSGLPQTITAGGQSL